MRDKIIRWLFIGIIIFSFIGGIMSLKLIAKIDAQTKFGDYRLCKGYISAEYNKKQSLIDFCNNIIKDYEG